MVFFPLSFVKEAFGKREVVKKSGVDISSVHDCMVQLIEVMSVLPEKKAARTQPPERKEAKKKKTSSRGGQERKEDGEKRKKDTVDVNLPVSSCKECSSPLIKQERDGFFFCSSCGLQSHPVLLYWGGYAEEGEDTSISCWKSLSSLPSRNEPLIAQIEESISQKKKKEGLVSSIGKGVKRSLLSEGGETSFFQRHHTDASLFSCLEHWNAYTHLSSDHVKTALVYSTLVKSQDLEAKCIASLLFVHMERKEVNFLSLTPLTLSSALSLLSSPPSIGSCSLCSEEFFLPFDRKRHRCWNGGGKRTIRSSLPLHSL